MYWNYLTLMAHVAYLEAPKAVALKYSCRVSNGNSSGHEIVK